jgi:hypothetical protein
LALSARNTAPAAGVLLEKVQLHPFRSTICWLVLLATTLLGCNQQYIANTDVVDNDFNRKVIEYCEVYRHAVEQRNTARLLLMAAPSYYEDGGNVDASDDLDYAGLENYLNTEFNQTRAIRYEIHYREVSEGRKETVLVDYTYSASYKIPTAHGDVWRRRVADNRLTLAREGDSFRILSGM